MTPPPLSLSSDCLHWAHWRQAPRDAATGTRGAQLSPRSAGRAPSRHSPRTAARQKGRQSSLFPLRRKAGPGNRGRALRAAELQVAGPQGRWRVPRAGGESRGKVPGPGPPSRRSPRLRGLAAPHAPAAQQGPAGPGPLVPILPALPALRRRPRSPHPPSSAGCRCWSPAMWTWRLCSAPLPAGGGRK